MHAVLLLVVLALQPTSPLSGPAVVQKKKELVSLVAYDFNSRLRRVETSPEEAAVRLMGVREKVDAVLVRRAAAIDEFVAKNLLLLQELDTAGKAGRKWDQFVLIVRAWEQLRPVMDAGPLEEQVAAELAEGERGRFRRLVREYWRAATEESWREGRRQGKKDARWAVELGERFRHLGEEIGRSFERQVASGTIVIDYFMADLDLSEEQRRVIQRLKMEMMEKSGMRPSEKDQQTLVVGALAYLNQAQRAKVIKRLTGK